MRTRALTGREDWLFEQANGHYGLLRHADLVAAGLKPTAIARRLKTHRLTRVHAKVYAFGHTALVPEARWLAALWSTGESTVLSHLSAAAFHGWRLNAADAAVHLSTSRALQSRDGIVVHRTRHLERVDVLRSGVFRVTRIPRTLVDLADVMSWRDYRALADSLPSLAVPSVRAAQARTPNRVGAPLVSRLIDADDAHTKSEFERRFLRFVTAQGLPRPDELNATVGGHKADCVYRTPRRLIVELDGRAFHRRRAQMRADRRRDTNYQLAGFRVMRLVWDDLHPDEALRTAGLLRAMLRPPAGP